MTVKKRTGLGKKDVVAVCAASVPTVVFGIGGEWFARKTSDRKESGLKAIGGVDAAIIIGDKTVVCSDDELKIL
jgi:hypothetical protein